MTPHDTAALERGLRADAAHISSKYLYDTLGSVLFEAICELPEYYPTRTEAAIFTQHLPEMAHAIGPGATLIDLGAGNCQKAARLFGQLHPAQYVPIDISTEHLRAAVGQLQQRFPHIEMTALAMDFFEALTLPSEVRSDKRLFFYPGSSIGNFHPAGAVDFLRQLHTACRVDAAQGGGILIGVDLVKDSSVLHTAYDDALGVTAAFNLNLLRHTNHLLGSDFAVQQWQHQAVFNAPLARIEMHLEARESLCVRWPRGERHFAKGERIHTENSYKYTVLQFVGMLEQAGFQEAQVWTDEKAWFALIFAKAK